MDTLDKSPERIKNIFNSISPVYNSMNSLMTFGMHHLWRKNSLKNTPHCHQGLDLCTGTGDFAYELKKICDHVIGVDFSENMLSIARNNYKEITFLKEDALSLSFRDDSFDIITIGFGVRNFSDLEKGLKEMFRVLRPMGQVIIIESGTSSHPLIKKGSLLFSKIFIQLLSFFFARDTHSYEYLLASTKQFPCGENFISKLLQAGFNSCTYESKFFGNIYIYKAMKV